MTGPVGPWDASRWELEIVASIGNPAWWNEANMRKLLGAIAALLATADEYERGLPATVLLTIANLKTALGVDE